MGITVGGQIINSADANKSVEQPQQTTGTPVNPISYVKAEARATFDPHKAYLVVNGKVKEIGKKSQYLFDMITK